MCHYPNLGSALDWLKICFNQWEVPVSEICVVIMSSVWNQWHGILKCQLFLQVIWQPVNCKVFSTVFPLAVKMHTALQNNAVHYGLNCISTSCSKKVENNLQNPSAVRMAYIDTQTRSPAIHLKQMRKQTVEIIENKYQINIVLHKFCEHSISQGTIVSPKGNKKQCTYPT